MSNKTDLSEYSVDAVYAALGIGEDQEEVREAVRFVYRHNISGEHKYRMPSIALAQTIEYITPRLDQLRYYEDDFFPEDNHERDALIIAVICDALLKDADNFKARDDEDFREIASLDFKDDYAINRADTIQDEAIDLAERGLLPDESVAPESVFIAHTNCIRDFLSELATLDDYDDADLATLRKNIGLAKTFLRPDTRLGEELSGVIDDISREIVRRLPPEPSVKITFNHVNKYVFFGGLDKHDLAVKRLMTQLPTQNRPVEDAVWAYWNIFSQYDDDGYEDTLQNTENMLSRRLAPFLAYSHDIGMDRDQYERALCTWILTQAYGRGDEDSLTRISDNTMALVQTMNDPAYEAPVPSQWLNEKDLFTLVGLKAYVAISERIYAYEQKEPSKLFPPETVQTDQAYASRLLADKPPVDCRLSYDLRQQAQRLLHLTRPELKRNDLQLI